MRVWQSNLGMASARAAGWRTGAAARIVILGLTALVAGCEGEAALEQQVTRPVKVAIVSSAPKERTITYSGVVRPRIESTLGFRVPGKMVAREVNVGDRVDVGQAIARLDATDLKLAENSAMAAVLAARTRRDVASSNLERAKQLLPRSIISQAVYDDRKNELDAAAGALDIAEAQLRQAANASSYAVLKADKAGTVTSVTGEPGQVVSAGQAIITLAEAGETEIAVAVPEQDAGRLAIGQQAKITLWAAPRVSFGGQIREIASQADPASRTYAIRVAVKQPPEAMRLGMTASVSLTFTEEGSPVVVPLTALTESEEGTVAFVVDAAENVVRKTPVVVADAVETGVQVAQGLRAGDMVVTAGVQFLRDGMRVRIPERTTQAGAL
jgi:membrane fusion protein, multidrug efflux system